MEKLSEQASFEPLSRCNDLGDADDLMWDGSRIVSQSGIHYATVEVTKLVYGGGVPSEIGLKAPVSIDGVTFSSPSSETFTATILLGVLFINITFADGTQRNLSAIVFLPPIKDGMPQGCGLLVTHEDQQAGFVVVFTPSSEPLDNPALRYETLGKLFQCRIYVLVRANSVSTTTAAQSSCTVLGKGGVTVHVADEKGNPIQNVLVMINGTFVCIEEALNQSAITDSNGDAMFGLVPDAAYDITVILPENRPIIVSTIRVAHTVWTTVDIACTPSANQCAIAGLQSQTQTASVTTAPVPFLDFPAIVLAVLVGFFLVAKLRRRRD